MRIISFVFFQDTFKATRYSISPDMKYVLFAYNVKQVCAAFCNFCNRHALFNITLANKYRDERGRDEWEKGRG